MRCTSIGFASALAATLCAGCAAVEPQPDYDRTANHVTAATRYVWGPRPDDEAVARQRVGELLRDGLTADEAAEVCLWNNYALQAALFAVGAARADVVQAGLLSNPTLSIGLRFPDAGGLANFEAALVQNLADLWQIPARRRVAERALDRAILDVAHQVSTAVRDAKGAYWRARQADRQRELAVESVQVARQVLDLALARQQAGAGGEVDVNLARAEVQDAELVLQRAELMAVEARVELLTRLSLTIAPEALALTDSLPETAAQTLVDDALVAMAAEHRLDLQAAAQVAEAAAGRIVEEQLKLLPTLEVGVGLERAERRAPPARNILADSLRASLAEGKPQVDIEPKEPSGGQDTVIGPTLGLELPIFNQNQGGIARARFEYAQSRRLLDGLVVQATQDVRRAAARARSAWGTAAYYRDEVLPLRSASLELAQTAYQAGRAPLLSVLEVERALLAARQGYAESLAAAATAIVELEQAVGLPAREISAGLGSATETERMGDLP